MSLRRNGFRCFSVGVLPLLPRQLRNSHHCSVSGFAENCVVMGISSPSAATRFAGLAAEGDGRRGGYEGEFEFLRLLRKALEWSSEAFFARLGGGASFWPLDAGLGMDWGVRMSTNGNEGKAAAGSGNLGIYAIKRPFPLDRGEGNVVK